MSNANTISHTIDSPVINWSSQEDDVYKLVLVGVEEIEKNWLRRFYYRHVPEFKLLPNKSTRYCVLLLENKFIPGKYGGEVTYFEVDQFVFRAVDFKKSQLELFRKGDVCTGTLDCKFEDYGINEKFVLPSCVHGGKFEDEDVDKKRINKSFNKLVIAGARRNKYECLENIINIHAMMESFFFGRTSKYFPADKNRFPNQKILSMNKICGTDPLERDAKYWAKNLPAYIFYSTKGLKNIHVRDYKHTMYAAAAVSFGSIVSSFVELYAGNFDIGSKLFTAGSSVFVDFMFRVYYHLLYTQATRKIANKPGIIGAAIDFVGFWKNVFVGEKKKK